LDRDRVWKADGGFRCSGRWYGLTMDQNSVS